MTNNIRRVSAAEIREKTSEETASFIREVKKQCKDAEVVYIISGDVGWKWSKSKK